MLTLLECLLLAAHLLAMNVAAAGPLFCSILQWWEAKPRERIVGRIGQQMGWVSLGCFFIGSALGAANGWLMWVSGEQRFFYALERLPSKVSFGLWELAFYVVCMLIYLAWWRLASPRGTFARLIHTVVGLAAATNLLWHFPPLMTALAHLAATSPTGEAIDAGGFRNLIFTQEVMSRYVHVWLASVATSGLLLSWLSLRATATSSEAKTAGVMAAWGGRIALLATLLQMPVGIWLLMQSPAIERARLMGGSWLPTALLVLSIIAALGLLHQLAAVAFSGAEKKQVRWSVILLTATVVMMSATLRLTREDAFEQPVDANRAAPQIRDSLRTF